MTSRSEQQHLDRLRLLATGYAARGDVAVADAAADVLMAPGLTSATSAFVGLCVALESEEAATKAAARDLVATAEADTERAKAALLDVLSETSGRARCGIHVATVAEGSPGVHVVDEAALPERFVRTKREPDKAAIKAAIKAGETVPGAVLKNTQPHLRFATTKEARTPA